MNLADYNLCSGCSACQAACPRQAIDMLPDAEGFSHPIIDSGRCVNCGICRRVCPSINRNEPRFPLAVYAAVASDDVLRMKSSSGGVFSMLAMEVLDNGGVVFGAAFDHSDWHVYHRAVYDEGDLQELRGSKYVQSDMGGVIPKVKEALLSNRDVLFSGTPCQVAGLRNCLKVDTKVPMDKLLLIEVVCHAVPSPLAWRKYLESRTVLHSKEGGAHDRRRIIKSISFRRKDCGWKRCSLSLCFANDKENLIPVDHDLFMRGFVSELFNRPSCNECACRTLRSGSDLSIADYWGVDTKFPAFDDDKGTSLVLVNTEKGRRAFENISKHCRIIRSDFEHAIMRNFPIVRSPVAHRNRKLFFKGLKEKDFDDLVEKLLKPSFYQRIRSLAGRCLRRCGLMRK